jgi:hypothetical protein
MTIRFPDMDGDMLLTGTRQLLGFIPTERIRMIYHVCLDWGWYIRRIYLDGLPLMYFCLNAVVVRQQPLPQSKPL